MSDGQNYGESYEDGNSDRNCRSASESNGTSGEDRNLESNRDCNEQSDPGRNGPNCGESNGRSYSQNDVENNSDHNWESHGGDDGGEFHQGHIRYREG